MNGVMSVLNYLMVCGQYVYTISKNEIILSRDIFGEKPLYIFRNFETLVFGSEIKYLHCLEDNQALKK